MDCRGFGGDAALFFGRSRVAPDLKGERLITLARSYGHLRYDQNADDNPIAAHFGTMAFPGTRSKHARAAGLCS